MFKYTYNAVTELGTSDLQLSDNRENVYRTVHFQLLDGIMNGDKHSTQ